jgi:hypothetical protein
MAWNPSEHACFHLARLLQIFEYLLKHFYEPSPVLEEQVRSNIFPIHSVLGQLDGSGGVASTTDAQPTATTIDTLEAAHPVTPAINSRDDIGTGDKAAKQKAGNGSGQHSDSGGTLSVRRGGQSSGGAFHLICCIAGLEGPYRHLVPQNEQVKMAPMFYSPIPPETSRNAVAMLNGLESI